MLSDGPFAAPASHPPALSQSDPDIPDPFSSSQLTYSTDGLDSVPAPSAYRSRRHAWVHIFPEGKTHQTADKTMRYFKWGVSRLILEAEPAPDLVPIWVEGMDQVMHESREFPRFIPRAGKDISVTFGDRLDTGLAFGDLRAKWKALREKVGDVGTAGAEEMGMLRNDELMHGREAVALREECTMRVRDEVLKVRRGRGRPDEDPKMRLVDTWRQEGHLGSRDGKMMDGSWVRDT